MKRPRSRDRREESLLGPGSAHHQHFFPSCHFFSLVLFLPPSVVKELRRSFANSAPSGSCEACGATRSFLSISLPLSFCHPFSLCLFSSHSTCLTHSLTLFYHLSPIIEGSFLSSSSNNFHAVKLLPFIPSAPYTYYKYLLFLSVFWNTEYSQILDGTVSFFVSFPTTTLCFNL